MELLEREGERAELEAAIATGGVVVVLGEAGIGKTALVASVARGRYALWGACDPLITPRPLALSLKQFQRLASLTAHQPHG